MLIGSMDLHVRQTKQGMGFLWQVSKSLGGDGSDVWSAADGFTFVHSGRPLPKDDERCKKK